MGLLSHRPFSSQMMRNLFLEEGGLIRLESTSLPIATYSKFRPQQVEFLEITDPKAVYVYVKKKKEHSVRGGF